MIKYTLQCGNDHVFEDWFGSSDTFDKMAAQNLHRCPECGSDEVQKSIMAPNVTTESAQEPSCALSASCAKTSCPAMQN